VAKGLVPAALWAKVEATALALFAEGQRVAEAAGLLLVDTKYELGRTADGEIVVIDEIHTPDSSRYWYADDYEARLGRGEEPRGLDKEYVRRYFVEQLGYRGDGAAPPIPDEVRVVWHPLYAESAEEVASLDLLHRAALCAEGQGAGWRWVEQALVRTQRSHGRSSDPREEIDEIAGQAEVDRPKLDRCLATGDSLAARRRVRAAVAAGVNHAPAVVVGGRIYMGGLQEVRGLQMLIEDELRPGLLERAVPVPAPAERPRPSDRRDPR